MRSIIHVHIPAFAVAVERARHTQLRTRPVIVGPVQSRKARVIAASSEAYHAGIRRGMPVSVAVKRLKGLVVLHPDRELYSYVSRRIADKLFLFSPAVEPARYGHFFLDMSGSRKLFGHAVDCAARISRILSGELNLSGALGIARNKLVSSVAARVLGAGPQICDIPPGSEVEFLAPLLVQVLPSVDEVHDVLVDDLNIRVVRELAAIELGVLGRLFGRQGVQLYREARGIDESPVRPPKREPSVLVEESLTEETNDDRFLLSVLYRLTEESARMLRLRKVAAAALTLCIRYTDHFDTSGSVSLVPPSNLERIIFPRIEDLFFKTCTRRQSVRYISVEFTRLFPAERQMNLFAAPEEIKRDSATRAMESVRERYGLPAIACGRTF